MVLGGMFGGEEGGRARKGFIKTLVDIIRGHKRDPKAEMKENRQAAIAALRRLGATQK